MFIGRVVAEPEAHIYFWPPDTKHQLIEKHPYAVERLGLQEEKGGDSDEMVMASLDSVDRVSANDWEIVEGQRSLVLQFMDSRRAGHALGSDQQHPEKSALSVLPPPFLVTQM